MTLVSSKKEILAKILYDIGAMISLGLFLAFTILVFKWNRISLLWGTGIFLLVTTVFSVMRFGRPGSHTERMSRYGSIFLRKSYFLIFLIFIPFDLVIQIIRITRSNNKEVD